jgi:hypothetical protein
MSNRVFAEEWRACLRAHYQYVIRNEDKVTERTLVGVLHEVGFTDDDLSQLGSASNTNPEESGSDQTRAADAVPVAEAPLLLTAAEPEPEPEPEPAQDQPGSPDLPAQLTLF